MPAIDLKNTDAALVVVFKQHAIPNEARSAAEGRPIFDDIEVCEIRSPGSRNSTPQPATAVSHWDIDPITGAQKKVTYAERFRHQYQQFKQQQHQTIQGTPLDYATFLTEGRRAELRALNVYTVEQLAHVDGQELKNLGNGGRDLKNRALEYLEESKVKSRDTRLAQENEALKTRLALVEEDNETLKQRALAAPTPTTNGTAADGDFADMSDQALLDYVATHSGHRPQGNLSRKSLIRMAQDVRPKEIKAA